MMGAKDSKKNVNWREYVDKTPLTEDRSTIVSWCLKHNIDRVTSSYAMTDESSGYDWFLLESLDTFTLKPCAWIKITQHKADELLTAKAKYRLRSVFTLKDPIAEQAKLDEHKRIRVNAEKATLARLKKKYEPQGPQNEQVHSTGVTRDKAR